MGITMAGRSPVGVGIIGTGFMAQVHSRAARNVGARLIGVVGSSEAKAVAAAAELGIDHGYPSLDSLLDDPAIDVVHVCTPNQLHARQAEAVIRAGKQVVCEKPLATSVDDARRLTILAAERRVMASVPFVYRFHPVVREARVRIGDGDLGRVLTLRGSYLQDGLLTPNDDNWRVDDVVGGPSRAFADIGSHLVDLMEFVTGDRVIRLAARRSTFITERITHSKVSTEDAVGMVFETRSGAMGTLLVSQLAAGRKNQLLLEISGSAGAVSFDGEQPELLWLGRRSGSQLILRDPSSMGNDARRLSRVPAGHAQGYQDAFNSFVADSYHAIDGVAADGLPVFLDGLRAATVVDAVIRSSCTDRWVDVPWVDATSQGVLNGQSTR